MAIQTCIGCRGRVNVPDDRGQLTVTCPRCKRRWFSPPMTERSDIEFRCAVTGGRFVVRLTRSDPDNAFTIDDICTLDEERPVELPARGIVGRMRSLLVRGKPLVALPASQLPALPSPAGGTTGVIRGWLSTAVSTALVEFGVPQEQAKKWAALPPGETRPRPARDFNFRGFKCPCCGDEGGITGSSVCGHMTCQGTVEIRPGGEHWRCSCGNSGFLTGTLETINELGGSPPRMLGLAREVRPALPAPETRRLPPPSRPALPPPGLGHRPS